MLHAAPVRPTVFSALMGTVLILAAATSVGGAVAAPLPGKPGIRGNHAAGPAMPEHRRWVGGERHRPGFQGKRHAGTRFYPGSFGYPLDAGVLAGLASLPQPVSRDEEARTRGGPVSFADLPASTGIRPTPASQPLFMRIAGRQVVADDGERILWHAGPAGATRQTAKVVEVRRRAGQRMAAVDATLGAPKIIVIRP